MSGKRRKTYGKPTGRLEDDEGDSGLITNSLIVIESSVIAENNIPVIIN
jgi:hypothetical protein